MSDISHIRSRLSIGVLHILSNVEIPSSDCVLERLNLERFERPAVTVMTIRKSPTRAHEIPYAVREDFAELSLFLDTNIFGGALTLNFETQSH